MYNTATEKGGNDNTISGTATEKGGNDNINTV